MQYRVDENDVALAEKTLATGLIKPTRTIGEHLRRAVLLRDRHVLADYRLMESFLAHGDQAAFEILAGCGVHQAQSVRRY